MLIWYLIADYCRGSQIAEGAADLGAGFDATDLVLILVLLVSVLLVSTGLHASNSPWLDAMWTRRKLKFIFGLMINQLLI